MSQTRFTPITSSLLARKGEAGPTAMLSKATRLWSPAKAQDPVALNGARDASASAPSPPEAKKFHKMVVNLTPMEFEKLGIAAVKKGVTRHQLVRTALDLHLEQLMKEYRTCGCMAADCDCKSEPK